MIIAVGKGRSHLLFLLVYSNIYGLTGKGEIGPDSVLESQICHDKE